MDISVRALVRMGALVAVGSIWAGCLGLGAANQRDETATSLSIEASPRGPGALFDTIDGAAVDALAHAYLNRTPRTQGRLCVGSIRRLDGGYSYGPPTWSEGRVSVNGNPRVPFRLPGDAVAAYVVHPRSGDPRLDRSNGEFLPLEIQAVEKHDRRHRSLYLLTPSRAIKRYRAGGERTRLATLVRAEPEGAPPEWRIALSPSSDGSTAALAADLDPTFGKDALARR